MSKDTWEHTTSNRTTSVCVSRDGNYLASLGTDGILYYYKKTSSTPIWSWTGAGANYGSKALAISDDGSRVAVATNNDIYMFGPDNNTPLWTTTGTTYNNDFGGNIAISGDGNYVAAFGDANGTSTSVMLFDGDGNFKWISTGGRTGGQGGLSVNFSENGKYLVAGWYNSINDTDNPQVSYWDTSNSTPIWTWTTDATQNAQRVRCTSISKDGRYIAVTIKKNSSTAGTGATAYNSKMMYFDSNSDTPNIPIFSSNIDGYGTRLPIDMSDNGRFVLVGSGEIGGAANYVDSNKLFLFDREATTPSTAIWKSPQYASDIIGVTIRGNGDYFAANITDDGIDVYDFVDKTSDPSVVFNNATGSWFSSDVDWVNAGSYGQSASDSSPHDGPVMISKGGNNYVVAGCGGDNDKIHFYDYNPIIKDSTQVSFSDMADNLSTATNHLTLSGNAIGAVTKWGYYFLD